MLILDTDHLTALEYGSDASRLVQRLASSAELTGTTVISADEKLRGWLAGIRKARSEANQVLAYARFQRSIVQLGQGIILPYDDAAAARFQNIRKLKLGIGTMDAKIAAIAMVHGGKLLSRNLRDFTLVPNLDVEDWT